MMWPWKCEDELECLLASMCDCDTSLLYIYKTLSLFVLSLHVLIFSVCLHGAVRVKIEPVKEEAEVKEEVVDKEIEGEIDSNNRSAEPKNEEIGDVKPAVADSNTEETSAAGDALVSSGATDVVVPDLDDIELEFSDDEGDGEGDHCEGEGEGEVEVAEEEEEEEEGAEYETVEPLFVRARQLFLECDVTPAKVKEGGLSDCIRNYRCDYLCVHSSIASPNLHIVKFSIL